MIAYLALEEIKDAANEGSWKDKILLPYKNDKGELVWRVEGDSIDMTWPGIPFPDWAEDVVLFNGVWYWAKGKKEMFFL